MKNSWADEMPLGFGMALSQYPDAMKNFALLDKSEQQSFLNKAQTASSKEEMNRLVESLGNSSAGY